MNYIFKNIEKKWQDKWEQDPYFKIEKNSIKKSFYCLDMFPYPSAAGLHVGHWKGYVFSDVFARQKYLEGYNVLHPMGWDAFGLPAENDAIKKGLHPEANTNQNISNFKVQLKKIGAMYDWSCELSTTDPKYYKWTQWIFLKMFEKGLAYEENLPVNWCPKCLTGLANEEATGGECDRCGSAVEQKALRQWVLKITEYADALNDDLDDLNWPEKVKLMQKHWIGRSEGAEIDFQVVDSDYKLTVFTTRADTLAGCTFIVIAADHDLAAQLIKETEKETVSKYLEKSKYLTDRDKQLDKEKDGVFTGSFVKNPLSEREIPVFLANYVLKNYGTGIVMGVPAHDQRDFDFAKKMNLRIIPVIAPPDKLGYLFSGYDENPECAFEGEGTLFNSGKFNELNSHKIAIDAIVSHLEKEGLAKKVFHYKLRDWIFSRQRYWGEPIPLVHCKDCGIVPVPESELPLVLPPVESYQPTGTGESPLAAIESWVNTPCPKCSSPAKRETNTMPQWAGSCWYFLRYPDVDLDDAIANPETLKYWLPVDLYVGGIEHAVLHLLYARFYIKFLHEIGVVPFKEPFQKLFNQGMVCMKSSISGRVEKMSKSKGNVVNPDDIVSKLGSDTLRMYMLFMGPPELDTEWQTESINGVHKFLHRLWTFLTDSKNLISGSADITSQKRFHLFLKLYSERLADYKVNTAVSAIMEYLNDLVKFSLKLDRQLMRDFLVSLSVMVPHFSSELLEVILGEKLAGQAWPIFNETLAAIDQVAIAVQVNGRLRAVINVSKDIDEISAVALAKDATKKWLTTEPTKTIFVKNKMVSFIFKDLVVKESTYREPTVEAKTDTLPLSKGSLFIQSILANHGLTTRVVELSSSTRTAVDAASSIGCSVSQIAKSLIFKTLETNKPVLILASGSNLVDEKIIELAIGEKIIKADANFTRDVTGFAIGGIPPVGHKSLITNIFIDEDLLKYEILWAAAGTPNSVFSLSPKNLIELTKGTILKIN